MGALVGVGVCGCVGVGGGASEGRQGAGEECRVEEVWRRLPRAAPGAVVLCERPGAECGAEHGVWPGPV